MKAFKRSKVIALAGISAAFALICEVGSMFFEPMTLTFAVLSAIFISLPFVKDFWLGGVLAYVVCSICAFFIGNIQSVPFIVFFGAYAVVQWAIEYKFMPIINQKWLKYLVGYTFKLAFLEVAVAIIWFLAGAVIPTLIFLGKEIKLTYLIFSLGSIPFFILYDLLMHFVFINLKKLLKRILREDDNVVSDDDIKDKRVDLPTEDKNTSSTLDDFLGINDDADSKNKDEENDCK